MTSAFFEVSFTDKIFLLGIMICKKVQILIPTLGLCYHFNHLLFSMLVFMY
jgi:hypothetical protein